ncbi:galanin receptor 2a-like [Lytechinus pictus]|uniref:galanin receptor 2a-like n=1 Tax=Lytechinus pictus TaxID=7653 RepID=UPI0030BA1AFD
MPLDKAETSPYFSETLPTSFPGTIPGSSLFTESRAEFETQSYFIEILDENPGSQVGLSLAEATGSSLRSTRVEDSQASVSWEWYPLEWKWWTIIQLLAAIVGIIGNFLVILVVFRRGIKRKSTDILIGTLAIADFLTSIFLIPLPPIKQLPSTWVGQIYCKIVYVNTVMWTSVTISVFILSAVSIERLVAIAYPLHFKTIFSNRLTVIYIFVITAVVIVLQVVWSFTTFVDEDKNTCVLRYSSKQLQADVGIALFFYKIVIPGLVMFVSQALTVMVLRAEYKRFGDTGKDINVCSPQVKLLIAKKRVVNMLLIVLLTFFICWGPNQIFFLLLNLGLIPTSYLYGPLHRFLVVLAFFNSCLNPVIYTARYPRFREALKDLFSSSSIKSQVPIFGQKMETSTVPTIASNVA